MQIILYLYEETGYLPDPGFIDIYETHFSLYCLLADIYSLAFHTISYSVCCMKYDEVANKVR